MKPMNDRTQLGQPRPAESPAQARRFRIQKLEERIAPKKPSWGGPSRKCCGPRGCDT